MIYSSQIRVAASHRRFPSLLSSEETAKIRSPRARRPFFAPLYGLLALYRIARVGYGVPDRAVSLTIAYNEPRTMLQRAFARSLGYLSYFIKRVIYHSAAKKVGPMELFPLIVPTGPARATLCHFFPPTRSLIRAIYRSRFCEHFVFSVVVPGEL